MFDEMIEDGRYAFVTKVDPYQRLKLTPDRLWKYINFPCTVNKVVGQPTSLDLSGVGVASNPSKTDGDPFLVRPMTANKTPTPSVDTTSMETTKSTPPACSASATAPDSVSTSVSTYVSTTASTPAPVSASASAYISAYASTLKPAGIPLLPNSFEDTE